MLKTTQPSNIIAAHNTRQLDSNVVAAVFGDGSTVKGLSGSAAGATSKASLAVAAPKLGPTQPDTATLVSEAKAW